jgi:hypothetical protein
MVLIPGLEINDICTFWTRKNQPNIEVLEEIVQGEGRWRTDRECFDLFWIWRFGNFGYA